MGSNFLTWDLLLCILGVDTAFLGGNLAQTDRHPPTPIYKYSSIYVLIAHQVITTTTSHYSIQGNINMPAETYSTFWGPSLNAYSLLVNKAPMRAQMKRVVNDHQFKALSALANVLLGAVAGTTATLQSTRIAGTLTSDVGGGLRRLETQTFINRASTAADVTALKEILFNVRSAPSPYVRDLSGNGGPAFTPG